MNGWHRDNSSWDHFFDRGFHREDGPAVIWHDGDRWWMQNNSGHRLCGPAMIRNKTVDAYFVWGVEID